MSIASEIYARVMVERITKVIATEVKYGYGGASELNYSRIAFDKCMQAERDFDKYMNELADEKLRR